MGVSPEAGGQGFPMVITMAAKEWFIHNFAFFCYPEPAQAAAHMIEVYGTEKQKRTYMDKMYAGVWGGTMALTEPSAGSDVEISRRRPFAGPTAPSAFREQKSSLLPGTMT